MTPTLRAPSYPTVTKGGRLDLRAAKRITALARDPRTLLRYPLPALNIIEERAQWLYNALATETVQVPRGVKAAQREAARMRLLAALRITIRNVPVARTRRAVIEARRAAQPQPSAAACPAAA